MSTNYLILVFSSALLLLAKCIPATDFLNIYTLWFFFTINIIHNNIQMKNMLVTDIKIGSLLVYLFD